MGDAPTLTLDEFVEWVSRFEGVVRHMYCDAIGLVTTGIGNLIEPVELAVALPWRRPDGTEARADEIRAVWTIVKSRQDMRLGGGVAYGHLVGNDLRLDDDGLAALVRGRFETNKAVLRTRFPRYESWPVPAQLALHGMAWAMGPAFHFPRFVAAVNAPHPDFATAALECRMSNGNPARNAAHRLLFEQADRLSDTEPPPAEIA